MSDPGEKPQALNQKAGRTTSQETHAGMVFTTHQRADLRWFFRIDGQDSETTYPTAGEAERGAMMELNRRDKARPQRWKTWAIVAAVVVPVLYCVWTLARMMMDR